MYAGLTLTPDHQYLQDKLSALDYSDPCIIICTCIVAQYMHSHIHTYIHIHMHDNINNPPLLTTNML